MAIRPRYVGSDPNELDNTINNPIYASILIDMKAELKSKQTGVGDAKTLGEFRGYHEFTLIRRK